MPTRLFPVAFAAAFTTLTSGALAQDAVARGKYLAIVGGCTDCHTPGYFFGKPDEKRYLGGSEVGFEIPGMGPFGPTEKPTSFVMKVVPPGK